MDRTYWSRIAGRRIERRRALEVTGATGASLALLAACGGGGSGDKEDKSSLITIPSDTSRQAKRGGVIKDRITADPSTLDLLSSNNAWNSVGPHAYSSLVRTKPGYLKPSENEVIGDLAESWEWSPDGLQIVMKLRQGVKWHNKPPVGGRSFDIDDVLFSWERFAQKSSSRQAIVHAVNPDAPVISLTAADPRTVVITLNEPLIYASSLFTSGSSGGIAMVPKETDSTFDIRSDMIGTGPFLMTNYTPSVGFTVKRHPDYFEKDVALVDQIDLTIMPEYAAALAQFKAGNIYSMGSGNNVSVNPTDILPVKREEPRILIYPGDLPAAQAGRRLVFGWLPSGKSPFNDERVRQAVSMAWDRDLYLETFFNVSSFAAEGLPVETRWSSHIAATWEGFWLDPQAKEFGPNARYFKHDVPEAKKLLAAAGYPSGLNVTSSYITSGELGDFPKRAEVLDGMIRDIGINVKTNPIDYAKEYVPLYRDGKGQYEGWAYKAVTGSTGDPVGELSSQFWSKGGATWHGFDVRGKGDLSGDPQVDGLIERARVERDLERRRALVFDIQRYLAKVMYAVLFPGIGSGFLMAWPCLGNFRVYQGTRLNHYLWVDDTKPPLKSG